jgi:phage/plasmid-like protein (TIGR03299 family)
MAANLDYQADGTAAFAYSLQALKRPWHGEGTPVDDYMDAAGALKASGTDYVVGLRKLLAVLDEDDGNVNLGTRGVPSHRAIIRTDTHAVLGVASKRYKPIQNAEAALAIEELIKGGLVGFETMGALDGGARWFCAAKILHVPEDVTVADETMERHVVCVNSHDGTGSCTFKPCVTLPVCSNTVAMAMSEKATQFARVKHIGDTEGRLALVPEKLGIVDMRVREFANRGNLLALQKMTDVKFKLFISQLMFPGRSEEDHSTRSNNIMAKLLAIFHDGPGQDLPGRKGTAWGAFNAVTAYNAHFSSLRATGSRIDHVVTGAGAVMNAKAMDLLEELVAA